MAGVSDGWVRSALATSVRASPSHRARQVHERVEFVIVHGTWMPDDEQALQRLTDAAAEVSCHYYITRAGAVVQLVDEARVAFHAGVSRAVGAEGTLREGLNAWSVGIELGNAGPFAQPPTPADEAAVTAADWARAEAYTPAQYDALRALVADLLARHPQLSPDRVLGHSAVAPGRKSDPGPHFDWQELVSVLGAR